MKIWYHWKVYFVSLESLYKKSQGSYVIQKSLPSSHLEFVAHTFKSQLLYVGHGRSPRVQAAYEGIFTLLHESFQWRVEGIVVLVDEFALWKRPYIVWTRYYYITMELAQEIWSISSSRFFHQSKAGPIKGDANDEW